MVTIAPVRVRRASTTVMRSMATLVAKGLMGGSGTSGLACERLRADTCREGLVSGDICGCAVRRIPTLCRNEGIVGISNVAKGTGADCISSSNINRGISFMGFRYEGDNGCRFARDSFGKGSGGRIVCGSGGCLVFLPGRLGDKCRVCSP